MSQPSTNDNGSTINPVKLSERVVDWITSQAYNNVMLSAILIAVAYGMYWTVSTAVPQHLKAIQEGYQQIEESHKTERETMVKMYDKWFDHITKTSHN